MVHEEKISEENIGYNITIRGQVTKIERREHLQRLKREKSEDLTNCCTYFTHHSCNAQH